MHQTVSATFQELLDGSTDVFDHRLVEFFQPGEELIYQLRTPTGADSGEPPGVLIYISPKPGARMPDTWGAVLDRHNLVWVGAEDAGNEVHVARRVGSALLAPAIAVQDEAIDSSRVYLVGFSGGGRVASMMMPVYPARFAGALFICGANALTTAEKDTIDRLSQIPMVFLTGTGDFNLQDTQMAISTFQQAGMTRAQLIVVDELGHALPSDTDLDAALQCLV